MNRFRFQTILGNIPGTLSKTKKRILILKWEYKRSTQLRNKGNGRNIDLDLARLFTADLMRLFSLLISLARLVVFLQTQSKMVWQLGG